MSVGPRHLTRLLVLDFEATCGTGIQTSLGNQEIIEFPVLLYDLATRELQGTFHEYVRPVKVSKLTEFCTELTGIKQLTVDAAHPFPSVLCRFEAFMRTHSLLDSRNYAFVTCGDWDLQTMLPAQVQLSRSLDPTFDLPAEASSTALSRNHNIGVATTSVASNSDEPQLTSLSTLEQQQQQSLPLTLAHFDRRINIKRVFKKVMTEAGQMDGRRQSKQRLGMLGMLRKCGLQLEGRHHSGIDDSRNILRIAQALIERGWVPSEADIKV